MPASGGTVLQQIGEERRYSGQPNALVRVRLVRTALELQSLRPEWQRLHSEAAVASMFNDWAWQAAWWRLYGRERELQVIVATRGDKTVGILPLYAQTTTQLGLPVRMLRLLGEGGDTYPDDLGPLFARGEEAELAIMLATAMLRLPSYDVAALADIDACSEFPAALAATARACTAWKSAATSPPCCTHTACASIFSSCKRGSIRSTHAGARAACCSNTRSSMQSQRATMRSIFCAASTATRNASRPIGAKPCPSRSAARRSPRRRSARARSMSRAPTQRCATSQKACPFPDASFLQAERAPHASQRHPASRAATRGRRCDQRRGANAATAYRSAARLQRP